MVLLHQTSNLNQWKFITAMKDINYAMYEATLTFYKASFTFKRKIRMQHGINIFVHQQW